MTFRVIHTVASLDPNQGGPSRTVPALCTHLGECRPEWQIELATSRGGLREQLDAGTPSVLHDHGQWLRLNHASAVAARRWRVPRVVSPRGMLSPWARGHRRWKKTLAWRLYAGQDFAAATVLHATSDLELRELREFGARQPIAVIPNGVEPPVAFEASSSNECPPYVLFMSRIHEKKGVRELLDAWKSLETRDWQLVLAGPDEQGLMKQMELPPGVRYVGAVDGAAKAALLAGASLFVLPSHSENFGVVVAEALMAGVPAITTHGTPWQLLEAESCGWWIPMEGRRLAATLAAAMATPADELRAMGQRGRRVVETRFGWPQIARDMATVYEWMVGGGPAPACVQFK